MAAVTQATLQDLTDYAGQALDLLADAHELAEFGSLFAIEDKAGCRIETTGGMVLASAVHPRLARFLVEVPGLIGHLESSIEDMRGLQAPFEDEQMAHEQAQEALGELSRSVNQVHLAWRRLLRSRGGRFWNRLSLRFARPDWTAAAPNLIGTDATLSCWQRLHYALFRLSEAELQAQQALTRATYADPPPIRIPE